MKKKLIVAQTENMLRFTFAQNGLDSLPESFVLADSLNKKKNNFREFSDWKYVPLKIGKTDAKIKNKNLSFALVADESSNESKSIHHLQIKYGNYPDLSGLLKMDTQSSLVEIDLLSNDKIFAFGAIPGPLCRNEQKFQLFNIDTLFYAMPEASYSSFPFFILARDGFFLGIFLHTLCPIRIDVDQKMQRNDRPTLSARIEEDALDKKVDVIAIFGDFPVIMRSLAELTGYPFLPPVWSLGFQQSKWSYKTQEKVLEIAKGFRKHNIPLDVIHLDIHYMDKYKVFTWDSKRFPNPMEMNQELQSMGVRTVAIVDPGVFKEDGYAVYEQGKEKGYFCKKKNGDIYFGKVWPGVTAFPDFNRSEVREWWGDNHAPIMQQGVSGIWNDMNDPVLKMSIKYDPKTEDIYQQNLHHKNLRNVYANQEALGSVLGFKKHLPKERTFVLTRSAFSGIQKFAALWTGDNYAAWEQMRENLRMVLNLGLSGVPFSGADVGGFASHKGLTGIVKIFRRKELFARWIQMGSLMPFFRAHTTLYSTCQEPWCFGRKILDIVRKHIERRYLLLPYIYRLFVEAAQNGQPMVRPLFYHYPENVDLPQEILETEFLVGHDLLAAPVFQKGLKNRRVYLPAGEWYEFEYGTLLPGNTYHEFPVSLNYYPLFARAGAVLPTAKISENSFKTMENDLRLEIYPAKEISGSLYLDDGLSNQSLTKKKFLLISIQGKMKSQNKLEVSIKIENSGYKPKQKNLFLRLPQPYQFIDIKGKPQSGNPVSLAKDGRAFEMMEFEVALATQKLEFSI